MNVPFPPVRAHGLRGSCVTSPLPATSSKRGMPSFSMNSSYGNRTPRDDRMTIFLLLETLSYWTKAETNPGMGQNSNMGTRHQNAAYTGVWGVSTQVQATGYCSMRVTASVRAVALDRPHAYSFGLHPEPYRRTFAKDVLSRAIEQQGALPLNLHLVFRAVAGEQGCPDRAPDDSLW